MRGKKSVQSKPSAKPVHKDVLSQSREVQRETLLSSTLDRLQGLLAIVNEDRRVVFANQDFLNFMGKDSVEDVCGMRPGEIFRCAHALNSEGGCGTSENCRFCGAFQAIEETRATLMPATREFRITGTENVKIIADDFRVRTMPFEISGNRYILISLRDISAQKRKAALERIFFHDILNTASSIKVYLDLLRAGIKDAGSRKLLERLDSITGTLLEEIQSQKILMSAENKTLTVQKNLISSPDLINQVIRQFDEQDIARGKKIVLAAFSEGFSIVSDDSLLRRVLANAMRNALEASGEGSTVTVGFGKTDGAKARFWVHNSGFIEERIQSQIFHRYFSTKGEDRGLGTYGMKLLTEEYLGGEVSFESLSDKGTTFTFTLPLRP
jgi:signal transduction histidine kinase